jgi:diguanylate cyclase (GGDEF)-like protein
MASPHGRARGFLIVLVGVVLLGTIIYLTVLALQGDRLLATHLSGTAINVSVHDPRAWLLAALVAAVSALVGWAATERARGRLAGSCDELHEGRERAHAQQAEAERRLEQSERARQQLEQQRETEHQQQERVAEAWRREREWNRQLREQIFEMQHRNGILGKFDVHDMVLQLTVELVEAEKGILLTRQRDDSEDMEVISAVGFEHDPGESALAQRFAKEVIDRDTTVRDDNQADVDAHKRTPADEEVRNLLAIPIYLRDEFHGVIVCANREDGFKQADDELLLAVGDHAGAVLQNSRLHGELRNAYLATVRALASVIEVKDPDLRGHSDAVSEYVMSVADRLQFEPRQREELMFGSLLHDVGKIGISERILLKPGRLSDEERSVMQLHPRIGYHLVRQIPALEPIAPAILHHHERYDGDGYPARLRGEAIPIEARIIAVADAFSAMTMERPYSTPRSVEDACRELERCAGGQFDPEVVRLFVAEVRRRPPDQLTPDQAPPDPELELRREPGEFVLGGRSFGITDSLTLLYSHRHFHETAHAQAQQAIVQKRPFGIVFARLTNLHSINHTSGFAAGDDALQTVAHLFRVAAGRVNGIAFRVSGCRIALLVPDLDEQAAERLAGSLREELRSGPAVRVASVSWRAGESGEQTIERGLRAIAEQPVSPDEPTASMLPD